MPFLLILLLLLLGCDKNKPAPIKPEEEIIKNRHSFNFKYKALNSDGTTQTISVSKTPTGAIIKYQLSAYEDKSVDTLSANISAEEWQNFINALQEIDVMNWRPFYEKKSGIRRFLPNWKVEMFLPGVPDSAVFKSEGYLVPHFPYNWNKFVDLMEGLKKKSTQDLENKLKTEYEKRFKKPITEQELSTEKVYFYLELLNKTQINSESRITITRTADGAATHYDYSPHKMGEKFSTEEWLDFINALYSTSFMQWDEEYGKERETGQKNDTYKLVVYNSNSLKTKTFSGANKYPQNWDKFMKVINDMRAKAKKDSAMREMESKMKIEYKNKFGKSISDLELYATSMEYSMFSNKFDNTVRISLKRTNSGALVEYITRKTRLKEEISMEEWLDFLNNLKLVQNKGKGSGGYWDVLDFYCHKNAKNFDFLDPGYSWRLKVKSSGDIDEMPFFAHEICTPKWDEFVKMLDSKRK